MIYSHFVSTIFLTSIALTCSGCGSESSDSGKLIQGSLTEAGGAGHSRAVTLRHGIGQKIENVEICALGECSPTDKDGQWGFVTTEDFIGGDVEFTLEGHGIDATATVNIPSNASEVEIDFQHVEGGLIEAHHVTVDGTVSHNEPSEHE